jgi:hypothetical protein
MSGLGIVCRDDLDSGRGVVLGRAVATLPSIETHPLASRTCLVGEKSPREREFHACERRCVVVDDPRVAAGEKSDRRDADFSAKFIGAWYLDGKLGDFLKRYL